MTESSKRPRILVTLPDLFLGGGQRIVLNHLEHRDRRAFDVRVLTLRPTPDDLAEEFAAADVPVTCLHRDVTDLAGVRRLVALLRRDRIDLVHSHGPADTRLALFASGLSGVPLVFHLHSEWNHRGRRQPERPGWLRDRSATVKGRLRDALEDRAVREYMADSAPVAAAFRRRVNRPVYAMAQSVPLDEMARAEACHDNDAWRAELGLGPGPVAVNVSRIEEGKGQERIISAMAVVRRTVPDAQLLLIGDGDRRPGCEQLVERLGLGEAVRFLGSRRHDVPRLLVGADVFAFASWTESFGLVVAEAMAAALPVVSFRLPSVADFAVDGLTGHFPAQEDDAAFAAALADLLADGAKARAYGKAGRDLVAARFPPEATARSFEASYHRILGSTATPTVRGTLTVTTQPPLAARSSAPPPLAQPRLATKG